MVGQITQRLPGIVFDVRSRMPKDELPRMDIPVFVGFAASGPLHTPVAVDDTAQFEAIFGSDAPLAWDPETGRPVYAYLAPAVRAFFRNEGRRCWVIRVAGTGAHGVPGASLQIARCNYFPVPGLARLTEEDGAVSFTPAFARARSEGSWSDSVRVGTSLSSQVVEIAGIWIEKRNDATLLEIDIRTRYRKPLPGDLLRISFEGGETLLLPVESVTTPNASPPPDPGILRVSSRHAFRMQPIEPASPPYAPLSVTVSLYGPLSPEGSPQALCCAGSLMWTGDPANTVTLDLDLALSEVPAPGSILPVDMEGQQVLMVVQRTDAAETQASPPQTVSVKIIGQAFRIMQGIPDRLPQPVSGEALTFNLSVHCGGDYSESLPGLGFAPGHDRYWGKLPTDLELYKGTNSGGEEGPATALPEQESLAFWSPTDGSRFPLAHNEERWEKRTTFCFPVGMQYLLDADQFMGPLKSPVSALERDGLASFGADLFLDPEMTGFGMETIMAQADFLRYLSASPRDLIGIHAALGIEEATIISVPDAVHRAWQKTPPPATQTVPESLPEYRPEWWPAEECNLTADERKKRREDRAYCVGKPFWGNFLDCNAHEIPRPCLYSPDTEVAETFSLAWSSVPKARYVLQESSVANWNAAGTIYEGDENSLTIYNRLPGDYFYRVRADVDGVPGDWSEGVMVRVGATPPWAQTDIQSYVPDTLLEVHRELARMCAARGDLFAVLALPAHYREKDALAYTETLRSSPPSTWGRAYAPITAGGGSSTISREFSYAALYHPWLMIRDEGAATLLRTIPPDGCVCGIMARRAVERGAWVAPANEALRGAVALTPSIAPEQRLALQEARVNIVRQEPRGFLVLDADTLSSEQELRPIGARRLLSLLRKTALRVGGRYVFEPNDTALRRSVQRGFEAMLADLHKRGAFKGATAAEAYQIITDDSLNTPRGMDQGRFVAELKVAPSLPMKFLTVRILQSGEQISLVEGR